MRRPLLNDGSAGKSVLSECKNERSGCCEMLLDGDSALSARIVLKCAFIMESAVKLSGVSLRLRPWRACCAIPAEVLIFTLSLWNEFDDFGKCDVVSSVPLLDKEDLSEVEPALCTTFT